MARYFHTDETSVGEHGERGMQHQLPLTEAERVALAGQIAAARAAVARYPTVKDAEAAGYWRGTVYLPCIGAHYTNPKYEAVFDPGQPSELLYDGTTPDSRIVGLSYLNKSSRDPGYFAGPNDHWHQHPVRGCMKNGKNVLPNNRPVKECTAVGGTETPDLNHDLWMVHVWVAPGWECGWGVFAPDCPELGGVIGGSAYTPLYTKPNALTDGKLASP
jgi:hypothetical protein